MSSSDEEQPEKLQTIFTDEQVAELQESFEIFDKDKDGKISVPEMMPLMAAIGLAYQENELDEFCSRMDQTGSGLFKFEEFIRVAEHFREKVDMEDQLMKAFQVFLFHDDDKTMQDETLFQILRTYGTPFTADEIKQLKYLLHKDESDPDEKFVILDFVRQMLAPKQEEPEDD